MLGTLVFLLWVCVVKNAGSLRVPNARGEQGGGEEDSLCPWLGTEVSDASTDNLRWKFDKVVSAPLAPLCLQRGFTAQAS